MEIWLDFIFFTQKFEHFSYVKATESQSNEDKKSSQFKKPFQSTSKKLHPKQEKTLWCALVDHLKRNELLPVVAFTFSRMNCDQIAENLINLDLTNQREKSAIRMFFEDCIRNLKEPDRNLPQIIRMREILLQGVGVHHSGILPLIKEVVEMLFQNGLVKVSDDYFSVQF